MHLGVHGLSLEEDQLKKEEDGNMSENSYW